MSFKPGMIIFGRSQISKRLMGPDIIIGPVPLFQLLVMFLQLRMDVFHFIKFLPMGPVSPLHIALQFRCLWGDEEEPDPALLTGLFKMLLKLRAAIDLDGPDGEGELPLHILQKEQGGVAGGSSIGPRDVPARDQVPAAELPTAIVALKPDLKGVNLDKVSRRCHPLALRLAEGVAGLAPAFPRLPSLADVDGLNQHPTLL
jgi:hypothetical protein